MKLIEAIRSRHSVRRYVDKKIEPNAREELLKTIAECNREGGVNIQLCLDEPVAFNGMMAKYGKFTNVKNYIALVAPKGADAQEKLGYYGEKIVIKAAQLGLNTCWVGLSYSKGKAACEIKSGEKLYLVISLGYGEIQGVPHKGKKAEELYEAEGEIPDWFRNGMEAVELAPTAINQQKFLFTLKGNEVATKRFSGFYSKVDLGIAKYHFEVGAGEGDWKWA